MIANDGTFWNTFWGQITIEITGGIVSGLLFLFVVLLMFRPAVRIAAFVCYNVPRNGEQPYYAFKFVNRSFFSGHNVRIELRLLRRIPMGNGAVNEHSRELTLKKSNIMQINRRHFCGQRTPAIVIVFWCERKKIFSVFWRMSNSQSS